MYAVLFDYGLTRNCVTCGSFSCASFVFNHNYFYGFNSFGTLS